MLNIPDHFFDEEERIGFTVSKAMKRAWAAQLNLLSEILEVADRHSIYVWLDFGSLLGAVRHHGYVPWDDDIDISVMRSNYLPLINYLKEELPSYRDVLSVYTNPKFSQPKAVISTRDHLDIGNNPLDAKITQLEFGFPCSTWIDLYPLDYVPNNDETWETIRTLYQVTHDMASGMDQLIYKGEFEEDLAELERVTGTKIKRDENIRASLWKLADQIASMTSKRDARGVVWYYDNITKTADHMRPLSVYSKTFWVEFELINAPIPAGYDTILRSVYGDGYMIPIKGTALHDYPHYLGNERIILSAGLLGQLGDIF